VCFWELVGQISSRSRPRHATPTEPGLQSRNGKL
jgi:hypothetical protein